MELGQVGWSRRKEDQRGRERKKKREGRKRGMLEGRERKMVGCM